MLSGVPNFAFAFGYTNASWTLKCDLVCEYVCRLLNHMDAHGYASRRRARPIRRSPTEPFLDLTSGYVLRAIDQLPQAGRARRRGGCTRTTRDVLMMRHGSIEDAALEFSAA